MLNKLSEGLMCLFLAVNSAHGDQLVKVPKRVSSHVVDSGKVQMIMMVPAYATIIKVPGTVKDAIPGDSKTVNFIHAADSSSEVVFELTTAKAKPTNLIIRTTTKNYYFDIVPNKDIHQYFFGIESSFGGPEYDLDDAELITSSSDLVKGKRQGVKK